MLSDIGSGILIGDCPSKNIYIYNLTIGREIAVTNNIEVIKPSLDFRGDPSYTVELRANKSTVSPGDYYELGLFISGVGDVNSSKLRVSIPPYIVQDETVRLEETNYTTDKPVAVSNKLIPLNPHYSIQTFNNTIIAMALTPIFFYNLSDSMQNVGEMDHPFPNDTAKYCPPFTIGFKISDKAPAGDHNIYLNLFYKNKDKWLLDQQIVPIHVRYWYESDINQCLLVFAVILGMIVSIIKIIEFCKMYCRMPDPSGE